MDFAKELTAEDPPEVKPEAEKPAEEKPEAEKPSEEEVIPEKPKNKDDWNTLRGSRDKYKTAAEETEKTLNAERERLKTLETELAETRAKTARLTELEARAKEADEYEKELAVTRVEATKEYKETIAKPLQAIGEQADILAKSNEADVEAVYRMLNEGDPAKQRAQLKEITAGWDDIDRLDLKKMAEDARTILGRQASIRENAHAAAKETEKMSAERAEQQKAAARKEFTAAADTAIQSLREKIPFIPLADGETEDDRFNALKEKLSGVDFDAQTPRGKAFAAATALMYPQMVKMMAKISDELAETKAALAKRQGGKASVAPRDEPAPEGEGDFFKEFGITEPANYFAQSGSLDVRG
jgi:myosin heavy subunit